MTPTDMLHRLRSEGLRLSVREGKLMAGPKAAVTDEHRKLISAHRDALMRELEREEHLAALDIKEMQIDCLWKQYEDSERKRKHAESLLELTKIQLGVERELGTIFRARPAPPAIPEEIRRYIASRCHPDRNDNAEAANRTMAWLNSLPREVAR